MALPHEGLQMGASVMELWAYIRVCLMIIGGVLVLFVVLMLIWAAICFVWMLWDDWRNSRLEATRREEQRENVESARRWRKRAGLTPEEYPLPGDK